MEYKKHEDKAEQHPKEYLVEGEQKLGYDSDYAKPYDYQTAEDTAGRLGRETVSVPQFYPLLGIPFVLILGSVIVGHNLLRPKPLGIPITPWI